MNKSKAGLPGQGDGRCIGDARGKGGVRRPRSKLRMGVAAATLLCCAGDAGAADINNTAPFTNNGPFFGNVLTNSSTIDNNAPGYWTGNVQSNTNHVTNNVGATWDGGVQSNNSQITNNGTWLNGTITGNGNPADPLPATLGLNGWIYNSVTGNWHGDVNGNSDFIMNDGGTWTGNINGNANFIMNNGGTWTGNVVGNSGYGRFTQVFNGGNALWVGDVQGNGAVVVNDGAWHGSVLGNSQLVQNNGTWTGNVGGNSGRVYNFSGVWIGDVLANGGTIINWTATATAATWNGNVTGNSGSIQNRTGSRWNGNVTGNAGAIVNDAGAVWTGNVTGNAGTITNNAVWTGTVANAGTFNNAAGATVSGLLTNIGITSNAGTLNGGLTNNGGITNNTGTIAGTTTVNGGTLTGNGTIANLAVGNGGTFAPGNGAAGSSMTVNGSLALSSGAEYLVQVSATSSPANVTGTATPGGAAVRGVYAGGGIVVRQSTILTAGAVVGTFGAVSTNLPAGFVPSLRYDATHAYLDLALGFGSSGLNRNQQAVADASQAYFNSHGSIAIGFGALTPAGLSQAAGEVAAGSQQATFGAMTRFLDVMLDQNAADRDRPGSAPLPYAASGKPRPANARDAYALFMPAPSPFEKRWSTWAAGYGGAQTTAGNATQGSSSTSSRIYGTAMGADYRFSPDTVAGFALAGGGTGFDVDGSGSGRSDLFQAGAFVRHTTGPAYLSAALAYGWQDITTNRTLTISGIDQLRARFSANAFSGRIESGYRLVAPWAGGIGIRPYAAAQATAFDLPGYAEAVISGENTFALSYGARRVTDTRSELGIRTDKSYALTAAILTLRGRLAWAHDYDPDRGIAPTFQALPGASFVVNGAGQAPDSALTTASVEMKWISGWSVAATFDGEFSNVSRSYAGKGTLGYAW